jgi:hypothetical protein
MEGTVVMRSQTQKVIVSPREQKNIMILIPWNNKIERDLIDHLQQYSKTKEKEKIVWVLKGN